MRVTFDEQIFLRQQHGGVSRYFTQLWRHANQLPDCQMVPDFRWHLNRHAQDAGLGRRLPQGMSRLKSIPRVGNRYLPRPIATQVSHHTYYDVRYMERSRAHVKAVTVYDMIPELFPFMFGHRPHEGKAECVQAADIVFCISSSTARDLHSFYDLEASRVYVTPLAADPVFQPGAAPSRPVPPEFVLYVGNRQGYKDFPVLLEALALLPANLHHVALLAVGGGPFTRNEAGALRDAGLDGKVHQRNAPDAELAGLFAHAACFVFPSRYEGFGLPTVEAMSCACPVLLARSSSHLEVGGEAATFFEPGDAKDLSMRLAQLLADPLLRESRKAASLKQASKFSWHATARATVAGYRAVAR